MKMRFFKVASSLVMLCHASRCFGVFGEDEVYHFPGSENWINLPITADEIRDGVPYRKPVNNVNSNSAPKDVNKQELSFLPKEQLKRTDLGEAPSKALPTSTPPLGKALSDAIPSSSLVSSSKVLPASAPSFLESALSDVIPDSSLASFSKECLMDPIPIANWMNAVIASSFFDPAFKLLSNHAAYNNLISPSDQYYFTLQPYGFFSSYTLHHKRFQLETGGLSLQGGANVGNNCVVGGNLGYWYSHLDYTKPFHDISLNTLSFGPTFAYLFKRAYIQLNVSGIYNSYDLEKTTCARWNLDTQLETGMDFKIGHDSFIQPKINLNYLSVFKSNKTFKNFEQVKTANFFRSLVGAQFLKEIQMDKAVVSPSFSLGWVLMQPITSTSSCLGNYENSNQFYAGINLSSMFRQGLFLSAGADAYVGKLYPAYAANVKIEWLW